MIWQPTTVPPHKRKKNEIVKAKELITALFVRKNLLCPLLALEGNLAQMNQAADLH